MATFVNRNSTVASHEEIL